MASITPSYDREGEHIGWQVAIRKKGYPAQYKTFRTRKEGEAWATVTESEMVRGVWRDRSEAEGTTLQECLDRYLAEITPKKKSAKGEGWYVKAWMARPIAARFMASIRGRNLAAEIKVMEGEGMGANHIRLHLAVISHLFNVARRDWGMESLENPVESISKPKLARGRDRRLLPGEAGALLGAADMRLSCLIVLAIETAMRREELASMSWENVDLRARSIYLPQTKNGEARTVPLSPAALEALSMLPRNLSGSVFGWNTDGIDTAWGRARSAAGIPGGWGADALHLHDLRHEATSRFFEHTDLDFMEIRAITGHKSLQMLARYTHLRTANLADRLAGKRRGGS